MQCMPDWPYVQDLQCIPHGARASGFTLHTTPAPTSPGLCHTQHLVWNMHRTQCSPHQSRMYTWCSLQLVQAPDQLEHAPHAALGHGPAEVYTMCSMGARTARGMRGSGGNCMWLDPRGSDESDSPVLDFPIRKKEATLGYATTVSSPFPN